MKKGFFITLDGCEGCGKSTQALKLFEHLKGIGMKAVFTREPGGTGLAEAIRRILLDPGNRITPLAELMLYEASRAQHAAEVIAPSLASGAVVVCDRFTDSTLAYQGYGRGLDLATIRRLNAIASLGIVPDLTIILDIPAPEGLRRARLLEKESYRAGDRMEREAVSFHRRVRSGYRALARQEPRRIALIRTADTVARTHEKVVETALAALASLRRRASRA